MPHEQRLPRSYHDLTATINTAGWNLTTSISDPQPHEGALREVAEIIATTPTGHRLVAWWTADAPAGAPRPDFIPSRFMAGLGVDLPDMTVEQAISYVSTHQTGNRGTVWG